MKGAMDVQMRNHEKTRAMEYKQEIAAPINNVLYIKSTEYDSLGRKLFSNVINAVAN